MLCLNTLHLGIAGQSGGGVVTITASTLETAGDIQANGVQSPLSGGGSGGTIFIQAGHWNGSGSLTVNGGYGGSNGGSGGGGRLAVHYNESSFAGQLTAFGGIGYDSGGPGTVFTWDKSNNIKRLEISNDSGATLGQPTLIEVTSMAATFGGFAWLTESGMAQFDIDEVLVSEGATLAINPTNVPNQNVSTYNAKQNTKNISLILIR
jgi:hypothetical protein